MEDSARGQDNYKVGQAEAEPFKSVDEEGPGRASEGTRRVGGPMDEGVDYSHEGKGVYCRPECFSSLHGALQLVGQRTRKMA